MSYFYLETLKGERVGLGEYSIEVYAREDAQTIADERGLRVLVCESEDHGCLGTVCPSGGDRVPLHDQLRDQDADNAVLKAQRRQMVANMSLAAAIESAKLQHGHRGAVPEPEQLHMLYDAPRDNATICSAKGLRGAKRLADTLIKSGLTSGINIGLGRNRTLATLTLCHDGSVRVDDWEQVTPLPSEIAAANMLNSGGMGVHYVPPVISHLTPIDEDMADLEREWSRRCAAWDKAKAETRDRKRQYAGDTMSNAEVKTYQSEVRHSRHVSRAFALGHADDYADRLSPIRRHGFD